MDKQFCPYCMGEVEDGVPCSGCGLTAGAYDPMPHHLPPGTVLTGRYLVGRVLGEGGFGITYIGCDLRLELKVAIKEYFPTDKVTRHAAASLTVNSYAGSVSNYEAGKERFLNEARTMARMDKQPQIVSVRDFFEANNTAYIVMEYVEGTTFKELVAQKGGRIPPAELLPMMEPLFAALSAMHQRGLIHRDISPDNLMLENGALRLLDFGCARESAKGSQTLTIALKHGYAPVEQYQHKGQGSWTDVYALSATIYYCLTGKTPPQALDRLCDDELILPRKLGIALTERQEQALLYGMGIRPRRRFQTVEELHAALYEVEAPLPLPPETEPEEGLLQEPVQKAARPAPAPAAPGAATVVEPLFPPAPPADDTPEPAYPLTGQPQPAPARETASAEETSVTIEELSAAADASQVPPEKSAPTKNKTRLIVGGIAGAAVILAVILLAVFLPGSSGPAADPGSAADPPFVSPGSETPSLSPTRLNADGDNLERELRDLMADDSVSSIVIPPEAGGVGITTGSLVITKPVTVEAGVDLYTVSPVTIADGGSLLVEGALSIDHVLTVEAGGQVELAGGSALQGSGLLWFAAEESFLRHEQADIRMKDINFIFGDPDTLFEEALRVTDAVQLRNAQYQGYSAIVIPSGTVIDLIAEFDQAVPVLIEEGAVVNASEDHHWAVSNSLLINQGTMTGHIWVGNGSSARMINQGALSPSDGFFLNDGATLYNDEGGTVELLGGAYFHEGTLTLNRGALTGRVELAGLLLNVGSIVIPDNEEDLGFEIIGGRAELCNRGSMVVGQSLRNMSYLYNNGKITVPDGGQLQNQALLENEGLVELSKLAEVHNAGVIRWYAGSASITHPERIDGVLIYDNASVGEDHWADGKPIVEASTASGLIELLGQDDYAVVLTEDVRIEGDLTFNTQLLIADGVTLTGDHLVASGSTVRVDGALNVGSATIMDGALLHVWGSVSLRDGGTLSVLHGGQFIYEGVELDLSGGALSIASGGVLLRSGGISLGNVLVEEGGVLVSETSSALEHASVWCSESTLSFLYGIEAEELSLSLDVSSQLISNGLWMGAGELTVSEGSSFQLRGGVWLGGGAAVTNHGRMSWSGNDNEHLIDINGHVENLGTMETNLDMHINGQLDNQGALYLYGDPAVEGSITGNSPE